MWPRESERNGVHKRGEPRYFCVSLETTLMHASRPGPWAGRHPYPPNIAYLGGALQPVKPCQDLARREA